MAKILVADDEELIRKLISDCLEKEGHTVIAAEDGEQAVKKFNGNPDISLALIDIMMPILDGWQVCRHIRKTSSVPIILISARSQDFDQIIGFESGADDYVTKPFSLVVLMRRVNALLQRGRHVPVREDDSQKSVEIDGLFMDFIGYVVKVNGEEKSLTNKEFKILKKLCTNPGRIFTREQLLDEIWGSDYLGEVRTVDSHMNRIRMKLGDWATQHLLTVYGAGYRVEP